MSRIPLLALVVLSGVAISASTTFAQGPAVQSSADRGSQGRVLGDRDVYTCQAAPGGSRVRANCEVETETVRHEQQIRLAFEISPPPPTAQCGAMTTTQYEQRDSIARVVSTLAIDDCTAASGTFTVSVRTKDDNGEEKPPLEFEETWQRGGSEDVTVTADYPIGENVELVSVRLRSLTCTCADAEPKAPPPARE
jgi:hypothetical protein